MLKMANFHTFIHKIGMRRTINHLFFDWHNFCLLTNQLILYKQRNYNRLTIFHTFVLSNFNFCPLSWHFYSETNTKKIEKIRFAYQDYEASYENLLIKAKMTTQHIRRIRTMALETFKILNGLALPVLSNLVKKQDHKYNFRYTNLKMYCRFHR